MDATFWATVGLVIFLGICVYFGVPAMITGALDKRAAAINDELDEAKRLREEAEGLLADYRRRREEAEREAQDIVDAARREADNLARDAERKTREDVERRTQAAEQRIARAEGEAVREVKAAAAEIAVAAASRLIASDGKDDDPFDASLEEVRARLN